MAQQNLQAKIQQLEQELAETRAQIESLTLSGLDGTQQRFELLFAHSRDIILFIRPDDGQILDANAAAVRAYGYAREEIIRLKIQDLRAPETVAITTAQMAESNARSLLFETVHRRKDESTFPVEVSSQGGSSGGSRILISIIRDITERKQAEAERERLLAEVQREKVEAQQLAEELKAVIDALRDPVLVYDRAGTIYRANASAVSAYGFNPSRRNRMEANNNLVIRRLDGRAALPDELPSARALKGETVVDEQLEITNRHGQTLTIQITSTPLLVDGIQVGAVSIWHDITRQLQAEEKLRVYAEKLEESNQSLQQFAFMASHDLQEPLRKIEAFGNLLLEKAASLSEMDRDYVVRMRDAAGRMRRMIDGLLALSRVTTQGHAFEQVSLAKVAGDALSDLSHQIQRTGGQVELGPLPVVEGDELQLNLLFQNLIGNALKFHRPGIPPHVRVHAQRDAGKTEISIEDNGIGFDPASSERMFLPFQRLVGRNEYEGSGMGLAICRKIIQRHGGEITARSEAGQGATFVISLPDRPNKVH